MAMAELLDLLAPYVSRLCGPIALDHGAYAAHEALITIFTQLGQLREPAALFGWARVIAIREAVRVVTAWQQLHRWEPPVAGGTGAARLGSHR